MSDPAIQALRRATLNSPNFPVGGYGEACAREALIPIREWHERMATAYALDDRPEGALVEAVLQELAPLIYPTEELEQ